MSSWQMFFFGGGKCPNLGGVNVRILGEVNVLLANDSQSLRGREILFGCTSGSRLYKTTTFFICFDQTFSLRAKTQLVQKCTSAFELDVCKLLFKKSNTRIVMYFALVIHQAVLWSMSIDPPYNVFGALSIDSCPVPLSFYVLREWKKINIFNCTRVMTL